MITHVFNALRLRLNKHLTYPDLFTRSSVHVVSGCLEVATTVKAGARGEPFPLFTPHPYLEEGSISAAESVF